MVGVPRCDSGHALYSHRYTSGTLIRLEHQLGLSVEIRHRATSQGSTEAERGAGHCYLVDPPANSGDRVQAMGSEGQIGTGTLSHVIPGCELTGVLRAVGCITWARRKIHCASGAIRA